MAPAAAREPVPQRTFASQAFYLDAAHPVQPRGLVVPSSAHIGALRADPDAVPLEADDVAELQLPSATTIDLAVHEDVAVDDGLFHVSTGLEESSELEELPEADDLAAYRDVDRSRVRHPGMLADQVRSVSRCLCVQTAGLLTLAIWCSDIHPDPADLATYLPEHGIHCELSLQRIPILVSISGRSRAARSRS